MIIFGQFSRSFKVEKTLGECQKLFLLCVSAKQQLKSKQQEWEESEVLLRNQIKTLSTNLETVRSERQKTSAEFKQQKETMTSEVWNLKEQLQDQHNECSRLMRQVRKTI